MPRYRTTASMEAECFGWTESHFRDSGSETDIEAVMDFDAALWVARAQCLGAQANISSFVSSFTDIKGDGIRRYNRLTGSGSFSCAAPGVALLITCGNADGSKRKNIFLRGIADDAEVNNGQFTPGTPVAFAGALEAYLAALRQGGYGWETVAGTSIHPVLNYGPTPSQKITFQLATPLVAPLNEPFEVIGRQFTGPGKRPSALNRPLIVIAPEMLTEVTTVEPMASFAFEEGGVLVKQSFTFAPIVVTKKQKIVLRRAGKCSTAPAGRSPARARG